MQARLSSGAVRSVERQNSMQIFEIDLSSRVNILSGNIEVEIENFLQKEGLTLSFKGTLARYPRSIHWHWMKQGNTGTLELTFWPSQSRLWFHVQSGRRADWITAILPLLISAIENQLGENSDERSWMGE